jgi:maleylpyruvate isomerase
MTTAEWMFAGSELFFTTLDGIDDDHLARPTALPGWTGKHVVAHVHFNALALCRLASWAATGVEQPMYDSREQRGREIEQGAIMAAPELRALVRASASTLADALAALSPNAWQREVVTAQGRTVRATEISWMRVREVYVHAVDLGGRATFEDVPRDVLAALLKEVVGKRCTAGEGPALAAWITGRSSEAPILGQWL